MEATKTAADSGVGTEQLHCFGLGKLLACWWQYTPYITVCFFLTFADLPDTCPTYNGPHSIDCLKTVWSLVGCLPEGKKFPDNLFASEIASLAALTYRLIVISILTCKNVYG